MKLLMVHNFYQSSSPSGEDMAFRNELELLKKNGIKVITYTRHNDDILEYGIFEKIKLSLKNIWSFKTYNELKALIKREKPDVCHFHNTFYLISPSAYAACKDEGVPVVQTLHNFRMFCSTALLLRDGKICEECIGKTPWRGVLYGCYRNSRIYTLPVSVAQYFHKRKGTWDQAIDAYIALTEFGKRKFVECGLDSRKIFVKPNFLSAPPTPNYTPSKYAVYLGRLSQEKGVDVMMASLKSINTYGFHVKIIGDGPLNTWMKEIIQSERIQNVELIGKKPFPECIELLAGAGFMIMPSVGYEGFPMVIREAFACGKPVIASRLGAMTELVEDGKTGLLFEPGNPADLAEKMKWMIGHEAECIEMGKNARKVFEEKYTAERNFEILMEIYNSVLSKHQHQKSC